MTRSDARLIPLGCSLRRIAVGGLHEKQSARKGEGGANTKSVLRIQISNANLNW
jgi:hypothetical protein